MKALLSCLADVFSSDLNSKNHGIENKTVNKNHQ
jgi:hypothetical protein